MAPFPKDVVRLHTIAVMEGKPIPAFYCCYLLRSTKSSSSLYVGSTPNPRRRLAQHNGDVKGGAVRTSKPHLQPWEMAVIVMGFPSNIAALQFEWAWHNTHVTKKISDDQRITLKETKSGSSKSGRARRRRPPRPRTSMTDKVSNLHLLLRVPSFARWPLRVRFFREDVHRVWRVWCERADGELRNDLDVILDFEQPVEPLVESASPGTARAKRMLDRPSIGNNGVASLDIGYGKLKSHVEKGLILSKDEQQTCVVCSEQLLDPASTALICPGTGCTAISHMTCLAKQFGTGTAELLVPVSGNCPSCQTKIQWVDMVKDLTLRARGGKEIELLMWKPRVRKGKGETLVKPNSGFGGDLLEPNHEVNSIPVELYNKDELPDDWLEQCDDDSISIATTDSGLSGTSESHTPAQTGAIGAQLETVVGESDWDNAEILD